MEMQFFQTAWQAGMSVLYRLADAIIGNSDQMLVTAVLVIVLTGLIGGMIVRKLQQPLILGYILAGVIVGIFFKAGLGAAANAALESLANIGVALLLFAMGLEFSRKDLKPIQGIAVWGTLAQDRMAGGSFYGLVPRLECPAAFRFRLCFHQYGGDFENAGRQRDGIHIICPGHDRHVHRAGSDSGPADASGDPPRESF